jgi:chitosanase
MAANWGLTPVQIATIDAIVSVFESEGPGDYSAIARNPQDPGGLSYGKHQAALTKGTLHDLIERYCNHPEADYASALRPYLPQLKAGDRSLDRDQKIYDILKRAASDVTMQEVQDDFFNERYMAPALNKFKEFGFQNALSAAVIYDSYIHSGGLNMLSRTEKAYGAPTGENEKEWIAGYAKTRKDWLSTHSNTLLHSTAIRLETFLRQMQEGNWDLNMPLHVVRPTRTYPLTPYDLAAHLYRNNPIRRLTREIFGVAAPKSASGPNGRDRFIQDALAKLGFLTGKPDGVYGPGTATAVKAFRKKFDLPPGDVVDGPCYDKMCDVLEEMGRTGQVGVRPGDGLKALPPAEKKTTGAAGAAGAAVAGAGATAGAVVLGAGEDGDITTADTATTTTPAAPPPAPVTETAPVTVDATAPATVDATAPATTTTTATTTEVTTAPATTTTTTTTTTGMGAATEDVLFKIGMHDVTKGEIVTVGACGLFVTAVLLFAVARRTAESTGK